MIVHLPQMDSTIGKKTLERFQQHAQSSSHKEALLKIELLEQPTIVSQLNNQQKKKQKNSKRNAFNYSKFT